MGLNEEQNDNESLRTVYERCVKAGEEWADKEYAASMLEETKKILLAERTSELLNSKSKAAAEVLAMSTDSYKEHVDLMCAARREANRAKVRYVQMQNWQENVRDKNATIRASMKSFGG